MISQSVSDALVRVSPARLLKHRLRDVMKSDLLLLVLVVLLVHLAATFGRAWKLCDRATARSKWNSLQGTLADRSVAISLYALCAVVPLFVVRGIPVRLAAGLVLVAFPALSAIYLSRRSPYIVGLLLALSMLLVPETFMSANQLLAESRLNRARLSELESVVSPDVLKNDPQCVFSAVELAYNPYHQYHNFNPVVWWGWPAWSDALRNEFGTISVAKLHLSKEYLRFKYIVLARTPKVDEEYDSQVFDLGLKVHQLEHIYVLENPSPLRGAGDRNRQGGGGEAMPHRAWNHAAALQRHATPR